MISRTGRPQKTARGAGRWTPAALAVAEALLCGTRATVSAIRAATGLSTGSCTNALRFLTDRNLISAETARGRGSARRIADWERLVEMYASAIDALPTPISLQVGVVWRDPIAALIETGARWSEAKVEWASTGAAAASVIAPHLSGVTSVEVYAAADTIPELEAVAADSGLRPIAGGRLTLRPFPTVTVRRLAAVVDGLRVAPWPRVYADLRSLGVRGEEAAEHLREVVRARRDPS